MNNAQQILARIAKAREAENHMGKVNVMTVHSMEFEKYRDALQEAAETLDFIYRNGVGGITAAAEQALSKVNSILNRA